MRIAKSNKRTLSAVIRIASGLILVAGAVALTATTKPPFTRKDKAYYLSPHDMAYVSPGVVVKLTGAQIASDGTIKAQFTLTASDGTPLDRNGVTTLGAIEVGLVAAVLPNGQNQYVAYTTTSKTANGQTAIQAGYDNGGTFTATGLGQYTYTFATKAPQGFDATATHSIGIYAERDLTSYGLSFYGIDDVYAFVPNGSPVTRNRNIVVSATCDNCHARVSGHGGSRTKIEMCDLCHTPQTVNPDTANTMDLPVLIHKIHMGSSLPSVQAGGKYIIIHRGVTEDFSDVVYPASAQRCATCHDANSGAKQANAWLTNPNRAACGACHDDVNFTTGANHNGLPQADDKQCSTCHVQQGELLFDTSIKGAHVVPADTAASFPQNPDSLITSEKITITGVTNTAAGQKPSVAFTIKDVNGNPLSLSALEDISFTMAGPTSDYGYTSFGSDVTTPGYVSEDGSTASCDSSGSNCLYTFKHAIPAKATGTYAIAVESERLETILPGTSAEQEVESGTPNQVVYFSVDGSAVQSRRTVVATSNCNQCHTNIQGHGARRNSTEYCIMCHNPSLTDASTRAQSKDPKVLAQPPQALNFNLMVHRIHTGANLASMGASYIEISHNGRVVNFSDVRYPVQGPDGSVGTTQNCDMCHVNNSEQNLPTGKNAVTDPQGYVNPAPAVTSACMGCHVTKPAAAHASGNTDPKLGEACEVCHGALANYNVSKIHAQ